MTTKLSCKEAIKSIERNIEHVEANMTGYELFYKNVKGIVSSLRGKQ